MLILLFTAILFGFTTSSCVQVEVPADAESGNVVALKKLLDDSKKNSEFETARWALDRLEIRIAQEAICNNQEAQEIKKGVLRPTKIKKGEFDFLTYLAKISSQERTEQRNEALEWAELNLTKNYGQSSCDTESLLKKQEILQRMQQRKIKKTTTVSEQEKPVLKHRNSFHKIYQFFKGRVSNRRNTI